MPPPISSAYILAPRALACSYSSSTSTPPPSPSTKPSRSLSQGRDAVWGSSLRVDSARAAAGLGTAGDHDVGVAAFDHARGHADGVQARGAGRDDRDVGALEAVLDR